MKVKGDALAVVQLYPDLLGTYGDSGNAVVLAQRLRWRDWPVELVQVFAGEAVPVGGDFYVVGGGEDLPQILAAAGLLGRDGEPSPLHKAVDGGAAVLAVCAGFQILGTSYVGPDGAEHSGVGLLDCRTTVGEGPRAVGELVVLASEVPVLTGYENHAGRTTLGSSAQAAGRVISGVGNGDGVEGCRAGRIWATYLHGPVLARNPALADLVLSWVVGDLEPLDDSDVDLLRTERLRAAGGQASKGSRRGLLPTRGPFGSGPAKP
ncbi:MAG: type 1 glutamine amidotransferase [Acidimicrobiales bacterium]